MSRTQFLIFAAMLMSSATAFAADARTHLKERSVPPPGQFEGVPPSTPPPQPSSPHATGQSGVNPDAPPATSPGEENKGKPPVAPAGDPTVTEKPKLPVCNQPRRRG